MPVLQLGLGLYILLVTEVLYRKSYVIAHNDVSV